MNSFFDLFPIPNSEWQTLLQSDARNNPNTYETLYLALFPIRESLIPKPEWVFRALSLAPNAVRVVILGQDPYPDKEMACGFSFATLNQKIPGSLRNIFKEIQADCGGPLRKNSDLSDWSQQGVLLLNTSLTVLEHQAGVHSKLGWQKITKFIINQVLEKNPNAVFLLWGKHAHNLLPQQQPTFLKCGHPSPLAYGKGDNDFKGCQHFKKTNILLNSQGSPAINW